MDRLVECHSQPSGMFSFPVSRRSGPRTARPLTTSSLVEPIEKLLGWRFDGIEDMTGLPEYRNGASIAWLASCAVSLNSLFSFIFLGDFEGGLLVDLGVLTLKPSTIAAAYYPSANSPIPRLPPSHPAIIEW